MRQVLIEERDEAIQEISQQIGEVHEIFQVRAVSASGSSMSRSCCPSHDAFKSKTIGQDMQPGDAARSRWWRCLDRTWRRW